MKQQIVGERRNLPWQTEGELVDDFCDAHVVLFVELCVDTLNGVLVVAVGAID